MQRILMVSDNPKTSGPLQQALLRGGYQVGVISGERESLLQAMNPRPPDIFVLDTLSARMELKALRQLLHSQFGAKDALVILLSTEEQLDQMEVNVGMDDFMLLPFNPRELLLRIQLLLWKNNRVDAEQLLKVGDLVIDLANYQVTIEGQLVTFTYKEYELLRFLVAHRGRVFTREALLNQVWGYDYYGGTRTVDVHIRRIRAKLGLPFQDMVETVRNVGYRFNEP
jgi:two-component system alkaline phosphatase synthesis response regulator PhoP